MQRNSNSNSITSVTTTVTVDATLSLPLEAENSQSSQTRHVSFDSSAVDNEHMNKKKSKICCIYKKPFDPNYSSESDEDATGNDYERQPKYKCNH
jgi:protein phosphatase 1 regulatory subunit 11